jgi:dCTP deaminase
MLIFWMPKSDRWIRELSAKGMIDPFDESRGKKGVISWGVSSYGYDMRVSDEFKIFTPPGGANEAIDPKRFRPDNFDDYKGDVCVIPPNTFVLARSLEYFRIPRDVLVICLGKSTYARCGILVNVTPLEPEWEGHVTISISNTSPSPSKVYANEGIAQLVFLQADESCEVSYADKSGKYQAQREITLPRT